MLMGQHFEAVLYRCMYMYHKQEVRNLIFACGPREFLKASLIHLCLEELSTHRHWNRFWPRRPEFEPANFKNFKHPEGC